MVLLVAVMNVAGLGLSRSLDRAAEISTRRVLGVSTGRLIRQLMTEQLVLAVVGGALGAVVAVNLVGLTNAVLPDRYLLEPVLDWRMTGVAFALAAGLGALVSLAPIRHALRATFIASASTASLTTSPGLGRAGRWFLVPQVVLSVLLLVLAGVHTRSLAALEFAERGYSVDGRIIADVTSDKGSMEGPKGLAAEERGEVVQRLAARVRDWAPTPIGFISQLPLGEAGFPLRASSDHAVAAGAGEQLTFNTRAVSEGAFDALGITLVRGHTFEPSDRVSTIVDTPAIVSEHFAMALWPNEEPVGRRFQQATSGRPEVLSWFRVIGVAADTHSVLPSANPVPVIYTPLSANPLLHLVIAGPPSPDQLRRITDDLTKVSPSISIANVRWMEQIVDTMLAPRRIAASLLAASGLAGLLLACTGLYGQTALAVARRRREFGIRLALGASPPALIGQVVREHTWIALAGSAVGLAGAVAALRISRAVVRGVPTTDLATFAVIPLVLAGITLIACFLPARHAAQVDPAQTLRE
jgi:predicted permease